MKPWLVAAVGAGTLLVSLGLGLVAVLALPSGHFLQDVRRPLGVRLLRNAAGVLLLAAGLLLSLPGIPGPGLALAFVGMSMVDFPGKRKLEGKIVRRPKVRRTLNRLRERFGRPRFRFP